MSPGWSVSSSSTVSRWSLPVNQTSPRLPDPTTAIADSSAAGGGSSSASRLTTPSVVLLDSAARATVGPTPLAFVISERKALTNIEPSAFDVDWTTVARPPISSRMYSPRLFS